MHPHVARIGAKDVANIPTQVHEPGASLVGAGPGASAPPCRHHVMTLSAPEATADVATSTYKVGHPVGHILLFKCRAQKGPQLGPRAHFVRCIDLADTPVSRCYNNHK